MVKFIIRFLWKKVFYVILKKVKFSLKGWSHVWPKDDDWLYQKGNRAGNALATVCPRNHQQRRERMLRQVNTIPYRADYFSHKMHFDQNEKLVMVRSDSCCGHRWSSRFITGAYTMPVKNNLVIYEEVFRYVSRMNKLCRICPWCWKSMTMDLFY